MPIGGQLQLITMGAMDLYLTSNPSFSLFKKLYKRHTMFGNEYISLETTSNINITTTQDSKLTFEVRRYGDLINDVWIVYDLPAIFTNNNIPFAWSESIGTQLIKEVSIRADSRVLDTQRGDFMKIYTDISLPAEQKEKFKRCVGDVPFMMNTGQNLSTNINEQTIAINAKRLYIPLMFWFCKDSGMSIPLIATQNNVIYIDVIFYQLNNVFRIGYPLISPIKLFGDYTNSDYNIVIRDYFLSQGYDQTNVFFYFCQNNWSARIELVGNYIFLGDDERRDIAAKSHQYLIHQTQFSLYQGLTPTSNTLNISFTKPIKELIWVLTRDDLYLTNDWYNFTGLDDRFSFAYYQSQLPYFGFKQYYQPELIYISDNFTSLVNSIKAQSVDKVTNENLQTYYGDYYSIQKNAKLMLNYMDRQQVMDKDFYQNVQLYRYHTGTGGEGIYVFSFAFKPEDQQPTGTQDFSRLNAAQLIIEIFETYDTNRVFNCFLYAVSYNVLTTMGGLVDVSYAS